MDSERRKLLETAFARSQINYTPVFSDKKDNEIFIKHSGRVYCGMSNCLGYLNLECTAFMWNTIKDMFSKVGLDILSDVSFIDYEQYETKDFPPSWHKVAQSRQFESTEKPF